MPRRVIAWRVRAPGARAGWLRTRRDGQGGFLRNPQQVDSFGGASPEVTDAYITYAISEAGEYDLDAEVRASCMLAHSRSGGVPMYRRFMLVFVALTLAAVGCKKGGGGGGGRDVSQYPGTEEGARQLVTDLRTSNDPKAMTLALKPSSADCQAVFVGDTAAKAAAAYEKLWSEPKAVIRVPPENTELVLAKATTDDIQKWTAAVEADFPGGYRRVADKYKPGLTVYRWKYIKPGEKLGTSFDGLIYINNHWAWFPKPWRALGGPGGSGPGGSGPGGGGDSGSGGGGGGGGGGSGE